MRLCAITSSHKNPLPMKMIVKEEKGSSKAFNFYKVAFLTQTNCRTLSIEEEEE